MVVAINNFLLLHLHIISYTLIFPKITLRNLICYIFTYYTLFKHEIWACIVCMKNLIIKTTVSTEIHFTIVSGYTNDSLLM